MFSRHASAGPAPLAGFVARLLAGVRDSSVKRQLRVEERLLLGGRKSVTLLVCHGRWFLLAAAGDTVMPLIEVRPCGRGAGALDPAATQPLSDPRFLDPRSDLSEDESL